MPPHVVVAVVAPGAECRIAGQKIGVGSDCCDPGEGSLGFQDVLADGGQFEIGDLPVELCSIEAEGVAFAGERDAAPRVGLLFAVDAQFDDRVGRVVGAVLEGVSQHLPHKKREVLHDEACVGERHLAYAATEHLLRDLFETP